MSLRIVSQGPLALQRRYETQINRVLATVRRTKTGKILLRHIERSDRCVMIEPYTGADHNAFAAPGSELSSGTLSRRSTAAGTNSHLSFSVNRSHLPVAAPQSRADEVLVHELAHALRQMTGTELYRRDATGARVLRSVVSFGTVEEFFSAMVGSVYSSELGLPPLGNHGVWPLRNPRVLEERPYSTYLRSFAERMPRFVADIAEVETGFNPFRASGGA